MRRTSSVTWLLHSTSRSPSKLVHLATPLPTTKPLPLVRLPNRTQALAVQVKGHNGKGHSQLHQAKPLRLLHLQWASLMEEMWRKKGDCYCQMTSRSSTSCRFWPSSYRTWSSRTRRRGRRRWGGSCGCISSCLAG